MLNVINLVDNKDAWEIDGESIIFTSDVLSNRYSELINNLYVESNSAYLFVNVKTLCDTSKDIW